MGTGRRHFLAAVGALATTALAAGWSRGQTGSLAYRSIGALRAMLDARQVSARELLEQTIARIEAHDPQINAVVVRDFERARTAASAADAALARGERRPLLGLPITVKESFNVDGLPTTWGLVLFKGWRASQDALAVARLKAAGAIVVGKTNIAPALGDFQSANDVYGTTSNPWDRTRTAGGSSGGSAAALAAGYVALELGSDINGSIRQPAHCCGVFGHKPSTGLVPLHGHVPPRAPAEAADGSVGLAVVGPMARSAEDLALALDLLAGPDEADAPGYRLTLPPPRHGRLADFRVLLIDDHPLLPTASVIRDALEGLGRKLGQAGASVARTSALLPDLAEAARLHQKLVFAFSQAFAPPEVYRRVEAMVAQLPADDQSLAAGRLRATVMSHRDWIAANGQRGQLRQRWRALFREWDVVLCPAGSTPAFAHDSKSDINARQIEIDGKRYSYRDQSVWPGVATTPGLPATVAPIGLSPAGLPIGVQIVGPYLGDRTTIAFARLLEREFGGFVPPPGMGG